MCYWFLVGFNDFFVEIGLYKYVYCIFKICYWELGWSWVFLVGEVK